MMAGATNGDSASAAATNLDDLRPPPGIIIPPPGEIRETIEKTAGYAMRGGHVLEQRIRDNHGKNPKFSFLTGTDAYNPFYEWRKQEIQAGRGNAISAGRAGEATAAPVKEVKGPAKPPDFQFSARMPRMSQKDLEIVRSTALFVAKNGRTWMTQLQQREVGNPQFAFLVPNHTFHNFFQSMVDQYTILLREGGAGGNGTEALQKRLDDLNLNATDKYHVLARAKQRAEYAKWQEAEKARQEEEEELKKIEFAQIDWSDFVVVDVIVFNEKDEKETFPAPKTLNDLQYASLEDKNKMSISSDMRIEEAFPFEDTSYNAYPPQVYGVQAAPPAQPSQFPRPIQQAQSSNAPPVHTYGASAPPGTHRSAEEEEELQRIQEREQARARMHQAQAEARGGIAPIKIKENYVPRAAQRAANKSQMALCPNCKQQIPINELDEHMRIELLDPQWKEQKAKAEARYATTNLSTVDVANNLKRMREQDDTSNNGVTDAASEEEQARRKKVALNSYDGNPDGKSHAHINQLHAFNLDEQIRAIHQKFGDKK